MAGCVGGFDHYFFASYRYFLDSIEDSLQLHPACLVLFDVDNSFTRYLSSQYHATDKPRQLLAPEHRCEQHQQGKDFKTPEQHGKA